MSDARKVHLRGESPWAEVIAYLSNEMFVGRIDNDLVNSKQHGYFYGDHVVFVHWQRDGCDIWRPANEVAREDERERMVPPRLRTA